MLFIKRLCLIIFLIITVLFTVGYASQPIIKTSQITQAPTNPDGTPSSSGGTQVSSSFYIGKVSSIISNAKNTYTSSNDYSNVSNDLNILFATLLYTCIGITILLVAGILLGHFGIKMISKIVFLLVLILMIGVFVVIQIVILADSFISNIMRNGLAGLDNISSTNTSNGTGYYLILAAVVLMIVNYVIYVFLA